MTNPPTAAEVRDILERAAFFQSMPQVSRLAQALQEAMEALKPFGDSGHSPSFHSTNNEFNPAAALCEQYFGKEKV